MEFCTMKEEKSNVQRQLIEERRRDLSPYIDKSMSNVKEKKTPRRTTRFLFS